MSFQNLNLDPKLMRAVEACGFDKPTAIQEQAIPVALTGRDLMASAQTGTGKTAAFVLPALQRLLTPSTLNGHGPRVLVLTPTRELAMQVSNNIKQFSQFMPCRSGNIVGGEPYPRQMKMLRENLDILVATPGRLLDHFERGRLDLSRLEVLVLDEADRMLDMGFIDEVKIIAKATPKNRQTLLFSATFEGKIVDVARVLLNNPERIQLAVKNVSNKSITQRIHQTDDIGHKHRLLSHFLADDQLSQAVIFTATKRSADQLAKTLLAKGHEADALHGDMKQHVRKRTVEKMRRGNLKLLVATDVAARGLDIKGISHVINFDLPMVAEDYIHRIGRTGRGGASGTAISFVSTDDGSKLANIQKLTGQSLKLEIVPGFEPKRPMLKASAGGPSKKYGGKKTGRNGKGGVEVKYKGPRGKKPGQSSSKARFKGSRPSGGNVSA